MQDHHGPDRKESLAPAKGLVRRRPAHTRDSPEPRSMSDIDNMLRRAPLGHRAQDLVIQPKLTLGPVNDKYEQEADRVAQDVVTRISRSEMDEEEEPMPADLAVDEELDDTNVPRSALETADGGPISSDIESSINSARSGGQPLDAAVRGPMESAFGADFSGVRVHNDSGSDQLNRSLQARAFTTGQDIFFRGGDYQPGSSSGQHLLAHELTHVVQQNGDAVRKPEG